MQNRSPDIYLVIEHTLRIDPEAFARHVESDGMPGPFVDQDEGRRDTAYQKACAVVSEGVGENSKSLFHRF